jgi:hypothetical protein
MVVKEGKERGERMKASLFYSFKKIIVLTLDLSHGFENVRETGCKPHIGISLHIVVFMYVLYCPRVRISSAVCADMNPCSGELDAPL